MKKIRIIVSLLVFVGVISCTQETAPDVNQSVVEVAYGKNKDENKDAFDKFLKREFTDKYNIRFIYKLRDADEVAHNVTPVKKEQAIIMANLIKHLCLDSYAKHTDKDFLKKYFPKELVIIGSGAYFANGSQKAGIADGGVKIALYGVNDMHFRFDLTYTMQVLLERYFNTIFHEFSHILHQNKKYSEDFKKISEKDYAGESWHSAWQRKGQKGFPRGNSSRKKGFISDYSSKDSNEDFVEIISHYILLTDKQFRSKLTVKDRGPELNQEGIKRMDQKLAIIKAYLKDSWNIDLDKLREEVQSKIENFKAEDMKKID